MYPAINERDGAADAKTTAREFEDDIGRTKKSLDLKKIIKMTMVTMETVRSQR